MEFAARDIRQEEQKEDHETHNRRGEGGGGFHPKHVMGMPIPPTHPYSHPSKVRKGISNFSIVNINKDRNNKVILDFQDQREHKVVASPQESSHSAGATSKDSEGLEHSLSYSEALKSNREGKGTKESSGTSRQDSAERPDSVSQGDIVTLKELQVIPVKNQATIVPYKNKVNHNLKVHVARCDDWKFSNEKFTRAGYGPPHPEAITEKMLLPRVFRVRTWKGPRLRLEPYHPETTEDFRDVRIPKDFSFRYEGLDEHFALMSTYGISLPIVKIGYVGDSTMIRLRVALKSWEKSHRKTYGALRFAEEEATHMKRGGALYELTDKRLDEQFKRSDIVIIKTQIDLMEAWYRTSETEVEREAIESAVKDIAYLIRAIREMNSTASILVLGMNPVHAHFPEKNLPTVARVDPTAVEFASRADEVLEDMARTFYDCSYMSVVRKLKYWNLCDKIYTNGPHLGSLANMIMAREVYVRLHEIVGHRISNEMDARVPPFRTGRRGEVLKQPLTRSQENYIKTFCPLN